MPSTVIDLLNAASLQLTGEVPWSEPVPSRTSGVYIVSLSPDPDRNRLVMENAPIDLSIVSHWISRVPKMRLDDWADPHPDALAARLSEFWFPDESTLYIGRTSSLKRRVREYYKTPLGNPKRHAGGHWIKTLSVLHKTYVYYAETPSAAEAEEMESQLIKAFISRVSTNARQNHGDPPHPFPFANIQFPRGTFKVHGISQSTLL
jgi:hypothetical protein